MTWKSSGKLSPAQTPKNKSDGDGKRAVVPRTTRLIPSLMLKHAKLLCRRRTKRQSLEGIAEQGN